MVPIVRYDVTAARQARTATSLGNRSAALSEEQFLSVVLEVGLINCATIDANENLSMTMTPLQQVALEAALDAAMEAGMHQSINEHFATPDDAANDIFTVI